MCLTEYDEEKIKRGFHTEGYEAGVIDGREEGEKKGREDERRKTILEMRSHNLSLEEIANIYNVSVADIEKYITNK